MMECSNQLGKKEISISISRDRNSQLNSDNFAKCYIIVFVVVGVIT